MRGIAVLSPAKNRFKQIYPMRGTWVATSTPKKQANNDVGEGQVTDKADPVVAFSKPPPFMPVLGPLVILSLFDASSSRDSSDD
ncbi:hypothetical protein F0562_011534 [Nyssa sinensis]|uniref:Uncharacterized protein n=1 Tax=Nyssa sinensis TaxID=561372 RepID=A0A5J4ZUR5_9ASTE|nr:hypothetical protein F0562_011534 [Nyssa sinensis]